MCAIHFIDLDQFKQVNDTLGHTARRPAAAEPSPIACSDLVRDSDIIARFGGDEFVILQTPITPTRAR